MGARTGLQLWVTVVVIFSACNVASVLPPSFVPEDFQWHWSWSVVALLPVAMFLDLGALLEENGWRGFALPCTQVPRPGRRFRGRGNRMGHVALPSQVRCLHRLRLVGWRAYLGAFTVKIVAISLVTTYFWARAGQATLLAVAMHGLSNDIARVGGLVDGTTWQSSTISELDLALPFIVVACVLVPYANRHGWGDLRGFGDTPSRAISVGR